MTSALVTNGTGKPHAGSSKPMIAFETKVLAKDLTSSFTFVIEPRIVLQDYEAS